jgi:adenosine deaminase
MRRPDASDPFDRIPKVELHCHVEGTVRSATVVELARKAGRSLPVDDPAELYRYDSLDSFLSIFWLVQETIVTRDDWARIAYESLIDGSAHGLRYREMFFTPARHLATGQDLEAIIAGLTDGIEAAEAETNVRSRLIADMDRAYGPAAGLELVERVGELRQAGKAERVIGIGADSTEVRAPPWSSTDLTRRRGRRLRPREHPDRPRGPGRRANRPWGRDRGGPRPHARGCRPGHSVDRVPAEQRHHREPLSEAVRPSTPRDA